VRSPARRRARWSSRTLFHQEREEKERTKVGEVRRTGNTIGMTKFLRWKYSAGINGCSAVRMRWTNAPVITTESRTLRGTTRWSNQRWTDRESEHDGRHGDRERPTADPVHLLELASGARLLLGLFVVESSALGSTIDTTTKATTMSTIGTEECAPSEGGDDRGAERHPDDRSPGPTSSTTPSPSLAPRAEDRVDQGADGCRRGTLYTSSVRANNNMSTLCAARSAVPRPSPQESEEVEAAVPVDVAVLRGSGRRGVGEERPTIVQVRT